MTGHSCRRCSLNLSEGEDICPRCDWDQSQPFSRKENPPSAVATPQTVEARGSERIEAEEQESSDWDRLSENADWALPLR